MGVAELLLVRHGESAGNVAAAEAAANDAEVIDVGQRDADVGLSPVGKDQAKALGKALAAWGAQDAPTSVWCSPYVRAEQTCRTGLEVAGLEFEVSIDERLRDRELGVLDLLTTKGVAARYPDEAERRRWLGKFYHRPSGGESWADLILRVRSLLLDLDRLADGQRVLVVCHDALVLSFRYVCERLSEQEVLRIGAENPVRNVSVTRLVRAPDGLAWQLDYYNDVTHLEEEDAPVTQHGGDRDPAPVSETPPEQEQESTSSADVGAEGSAHGR